MMLVVRAMSKVEEMELMGIAVGYGYDDSSSYYDYYDTKYQEGYEEGYDDGYCSGQSEYEEEQDEDDDW